MSGRDGCDWTPIDGDPAPGDPDLAERLGKRFQTVGEDAGSSARLLRRLGSDSSGVWRGPASRAFRKTLEKLPADLKKVEVSYKRAGGALLDYGGSLRRRQEDAADALTRATAALEKLGRAQAGQRHQQQVAEAARRTAAAADEPYVAPPGHDFAGDISSASADLKKARGDASDIRSRHERAARKAASVLDDAASKGIKARSWLRERWDEGRRAVVGAARTVARSVAAAGMVIALVLLVIAVVVVVCLIGGFVLPALVAAVLAQAVLVSAALALMGTAATLVLVIAGEETLTTLAVDVICILPAGRILARLGPPGRWVEDLLERLGGRGFRDRVQSQSDDAVRAAEEGRRTAKEAAEASRARQTKINDARRRQKLALRQQQSGMTHLEESWKRNLRRTEADLREAESAHVAAQRAYGEAVAQMQALRVQPGGKAVQIAQAERRVRASNVEALEQARYMAQARDVARRTAEDYDRWADEQAAARPSGPVR